MDGAERSKTPFQEEENHYRHMLDTYNNYMERVFRGQETIKPVKTEPTAATYLLEQVKE